MAYHRPQAAVLAKRLRKPRRFIQILTGPRQVGKTTLAQQVVRICSLAAQFASADEPGLRGLDWITQQWDAARLMAQKEGQKGAVLVLDEIQKITGWSERIKRHWDEDSRLKVPLHVVILGSAPLMLARGLTESLAGRFEVLHLPHWSFGEMQEAFGWSLEEYLFHGGYPGAAPLIQDVQRWSRYLADSLIETTMARDVLLMKRVDKPALLRRLFELACLYSGQVLAYNKMLGQLQDAGNTITLAHYLDLLAGAGMVCGLPKYTREVVRSRGTSPKMQVYNTALMTAQSGLNRTQARANGEFWGRLVESAVGAHLANAAACGDCKLFYWRERNEEVDFVVERGGRLTAIEVKSSRAPFRHSGLAAFSKAFRPARSLLVGGDGIPLEDFLRRPVLEWVAG